jgi:signal transduction histidine kinase
MKKISTFCLLVLILMLCVVSCTKGNDNKYMPSTQYEDILTAADSLVDISPDSALILCRQFFEGYSTPKDSLYAKAKLIEGNAYFSIGDMEEAIEALKAARDMAKRNADQLLLVNATTDLGVVKRVAGETDSAMALYQEALSLIEAGDYKDEKAHLLTSIAILYANTGHLDEARDYADRAVEAANESMDMDMIMYATSQAGAIYNLLGNSEKGLQLTHEAMSMARKMNLPRYEIKTLGHLIDMHLKAGNKDSVAYYLKRGEELSAQFPENSVEGVGFLEEKYVVLAALGRYRESLDVQHHLLNLQNKAATFMPTEKLWLRMARNYAALHNSDSTTYCYERALELTDSIRAEETDKQLSEFYARFKTSEKELALANVEKEKARSEMWLAIWVAIAILVIIVSILYIRDRKKKEGMRILQNRIKAKEEERKRLAKELHDGVCNDLYGIEMLMQAGCPDDEVLDDVERIRTDVRRISHELMPPSLQDVNFAQAMEDMVSKLRHAYPDKTFNLSTPSNIDWDRVTENITYSLYRICQELMGNMLRHANPTTISLSISHDADVLKVELSHDGNVSSTSEGSGIGIESVKDRLAAIDATAEGLPYAPVMTITCRMQYHGKP